MDTVYQIDPGCIIPHSVKKTITVKKLNDLAVIPTKAHAEDAGFDLVATSVEYKGNQLIIGTGLSVAFPKGHMLCLYPRSSIYKTGLQLANSVGVVDCLYRGEVKVIFNIIDSDRSKHYQVGDRCCQAVLIELPCTEIVEVSELNETERGSGGFGSSGR